MDYSYGGPAVAKGTNHGATVSLGGPSAVPQMSGRPAVAAKNGPGGPILGGDQL